MRFDTKASRGSPSARGSDRQLVHGEGEKKEPGAFFVATRGQCWSDCVEAEQLADMDL